MGLESSSGQVLEFLTVTSLPYRGASDEEARRIVRSHAIRDANRRKRLKPIADSKKTKVSAAKAPPLQSSLTTKFKLNKSPPEEKKQSLDKYEKYMEGRLVKQGAWSSLHPEIGLVIGAGLFDPFQSLPIKVGPKQEALLDYQKSQLDQCAFTIGSKECLFAFALTDPAWLNATLCLISLHYDLQTGKGISHESFMHRGETLRIVNQRLNKSPHDVSEETIAAIASLAYFDITNGLLESATMHVNGLLEILANRGPGFEGMLPLGNVWLQKVVAWADLAYCSAWDMTPKLPLITTSVCHSSILGFKEMLLAYYPIHTQIYSPHDLVGEMTDIFQVMRLLSLRIHALPSELPERILYDRGLYMSEYKLLVVLDAADDVDLDMVMPNRSSHIYGSCRLAAYLYLYIILRELPTSATMVQMVLRRLKGILESASADLLILWSEDQQLFLWILYMGAIASIDGAERKFFVEVLRRAAKRMELETLEAFTDALKEVLWEPVFCETGPTTRRLWNELQQS